MKRRLPIGSPAVLLPAAVIVAGLLVTWLVGWKAGAITAAAIALAGLVEREMTRRRAEREAPPGLTAKQRERRRAWLRVQVSRLRLGESGQLAKMVREGDPIDQSTTYVAQDEGRPRVRVGQSQLRPWSEITRRWDARSWRLVILGDPGYGKTVAALTLVKHINARTEEGACVAELFPLAEWQRWRAEHQTAPFGDWLAEQLTHTHPHLDAVEARELLDARLVLPVLDGLDEIARKEDRRACVSAIDAYAERGEPHRPFVLTCRAREYYELAPDWVRDDETVVLVGLQPDQIRERLAAQVSGRPAWSALRDRQAAGDATINELFSSPLRLAIALQVYRDGDPSELVTLSVSEARERLWELLLRTSAEGYRGATAAQVRAWLVWLADGMLRTRRQRFMLHELYLLYPQSPRIFRAFRIAVGLGAGLVFGLVNGLVFGLVVGLPFGLLVGVLLVIIVSPQLSVRAQGGWRDRVQYATRAESLVAAVVCGVGAGVYGGLVLGLAWGLVGGPAAGLIWFVRDVLVPEKVAADPPRWFARARPDGVLIASRSHGLLSGLVSGLVVALIVGLAFGVVFGLAGGLVFGLAWGLVLGLDFGLAVGLGAGLGFGLDGWLYHHWLRWRLATQGVLPARLPAFLEWCAQDERGWLRISDAYEFRHRELLEHLAPEAPPAE